MTSRARILALVLTAAVFASAARESAAANAAPRILAFAHRGYLLLFIGKYDPKHGWVEPDDFFAPPQQSDPVTLFGTSGRLGVARITQSRRPSPIATPRDWSAPVSSWSWDRQPYALAILGDWSDENDHADSIPLDDAQGVEAVRHYLAGKGLKEAAPHITQAFAVDVDGQTEQFYCAHSDDDRVTAQDAANIYAIAIMVKGGRTEPLASQTWFKPAGRTKADDATYHGTRDYLRFISFMDIDGDGRKEIVLYRAKTDATQIDVFHLDGVHVKTVLTAFRALQF